MLPSLEHPLSLASNASGDEPFTIATARCIVLGRERSGVWEIILEGIRVAHSFDIIDDTVTAFQLSPLGAERQLTINGADVTERIVASPHTPAVAIEWTAHADARLQLRWTGSDERASFMFSRPVEITEGGTLLLLSAGESVSLIVTTEDEVDDEEPIAWVQQHAADALRRDQEWLRADIPDPDLTTALEWAKLRLSTMQRVESPRPPVALLAVGDFKKARGQLDSLLSPLDFLLLVSRYLAASGDDTFVHANWDYVREIYERSGTRVDADTLRELAIAAETIGDSEFSSELIRIARGRPIGSLPWQDFQDGKTSAGVDHWIRMARVCFDWEKGGWPEDDRASAASVIASFVYGLLGYSPDAPKGRLRLRPQIPEEWHRLTVDNIRIADAFVSLEYIRDGDTCRFALSQIAGAYPVRLIFEPAMPATVIRASVDGKPATLDMVPFGERIVVPVQIVLDDRREIELELAGR